jgi:hypothetical protein
MKTPEDEAFDELARKQGAWGGGFQAKRQMAADKLHWSDCAVHNGPAYPAGKCDCGVAQEPLSEVLKLALEALETERDIYREHDEDGAPEYILDAITSIKIALAQPAQDVDYWIREATAARQAEMAMRRELEAQPAQPVQEATAFIAAEERKREERYGYFPKLHPSEYMDEPPLPVQREWVGLTDEEMENIRASFLGQFLETWEFAYKVQVATQAKLKEKNT